MPGPIKGWEQLLGGLGIIIREMKSQGGSREKKIQSPQVGVSVYLAKT